ncbi:hypothetical protein AAG570_004869 [Ranatra chinensis]|uniref:Uncharacterized protein n=1 Tax=Ranatra chinensis TaxID=642074 RepID=A0ABD0Y1B2_9HEMI
MVLNCMVHPKEETLTEFRVFNQKSSYRNAVCLDEGSGGAAHTRAHRHRSEIQKSKRTAILDLVNPVSSGLPQFLYQAEGLVVRRWKKGTEADRAKKSDPLTDVGELSAEG